MIPNNWNDLHTEQPKAAAKIESALALEYGRVINVTRDSLLTGNYDVEIFGKGGLVARGCRQSSELAGYNGTGSIRPLVDGTPVVVAFKQGRFSEGTIIGCFFTSGNTEDYLAGKILPPGELVDGPYGPAEVNQRPLHPGVVVQPHSIVDVFPGKAFGEPYNDPAYQFELEKQLEARQGMVGMDIISEGGDHVRYSGGVDIRYSDRSSVDIIVSDSSDCAVRLVRSARTYVEMASLFTGVIVEDLEKMADITPAIEQIVEALNKNQPEAASPDPNAPGGIELDLPGLELPEGMRVQSFSIPEAKVLRKAHSIPDELRAKKALDLAREYISLAKNCVAVAGQNAQTVQSLVDQYQSHNGNPISPTDGLTVPKEYETPNKSPRREKATLVILHETVGDLQSAINTVTNPTARVSYHAIVARDGSIHRIVPDNYAAWAAGGTRARPSVFVNSQGVAESGNVNHMSWNYSLESPPNSNTNHTGYTDAQYRSLARLVHQTGVPADRITTHAAVDRTGERSDPRNFDLPRFNRYLNELRGSPQVINTRVFRGR